MFYPAEPLNPNRLLNIIEHYTSEEPAYRFAACHGLVREERAIKCMVPALTHVSYVAPTRWRQMKLARALLPIPEPSASILMLDVDRPKESREIFIFPHCSDPLLVHEGNVGTGNIEHLKVREPDDTDTRLINAVLTELAA